MSDSKLSKKEQQELNRLEDEAFKELGQIIAIAYQVQDIEYINSLILAWERKYQKLLSNPDFKKKFKKILDETYDELVRYILSKIRLKEEKLIKNQRKALNQLYNIIKDTYDLDTLKSKIKKWESKYPYNSFLKMYQKRIDSAKREKNLQENAFKQEEAFKDLYYGVANRSGTIEELKDYLNRWEEKYSINNKFTIDQFINHQTEVKRYTSNEFLISIAKKDDNILDDHTNQPSSSSIDIQNSAYKHLKSILSSKNNINDVFKWVYENHSIKFNDKYKELILSAIYLDYSPKYLNSLIIPDIDLTKSSLPLKQYSQINEIKKYAIISYFNLLLPPNEAIKNSHFVNHIKSIYTQLEKSKHTDIINNFQDEVTCFSVEKSKGKIETDSKTTTIDISVDTTLDTESPILDIEKLIEESDAVELITPSKSKKSAIAASTISEDTILEAQTPSVKTAISKDSNPKSVKFVEHDKSTTPEATTSSITVSKSESKSSKSSTVISNSTYISDEQDISTPETSIEPSEENIDYDTIVAISPVFFETINNYSIQANLIETANNKITKKTDIHISLDNSNTKTRNQSE